jgi:hypothetical protein
MGVSAFASSACIVSCSYFHELSAATALGFVLLYLGLQLVSRRTTGNRWLRALPAAVMAGLTLCGVWLVVFSKVNRDKAHHYHDAMSSSAMNVRYSARQSMTYLYQFITDLKIWQMALLCFAVLLLLQLLFPTRPKASQNTERPVAVPLGRQSLPLLVALASVPVYGFILCYGTSSLVGQRVYGQLVVMAVLTAIPLLNRAAAWAAQAIQSAMDASHRDAAELALGGLLAVAICASILLRTDWPSVYRIATHDGRIWSAEMAARRDAIAAAKLLGQDSIRLKRVSLRPPYVSLSPYEDLTETCTKETMSYGNTVWSLYYQMKVICLAKD